MRPLITTQRVMTWIGLCPFDNDASKWKKAASFGIFAMVNFIVLSSLIATATYAWRFKSTHLEKSLYALFHVLLFADLLYTLLALFFVKHETKALFDQLSEIYNANAHVTSFRYLAQANNFCERMWTFYFKYAIFIDLTIFVLYPISMALCWMNGNFDTECFYHPLLLILPWNQHTIISYFGDFLFIMALGQLYMISNGSVVLLFINSCLHHQGVFKMFRHMALQLNNPDKDGNDEKFLCHMIRFHISVKDWFLHSADIHSRYVMIHIICSVITLASSIFQLDLQFKQIDQNICVVLVYAFTGLFNLFVHFYFGKLATENFAKMPDCLYNIDWQNLPIKTQKTLILMIMNMQRPLHYHGFGVTILNLETFSKVMKTVVSYFMMFRTLTSE